MDEVRVRPRNVEIEFDAPSLECTFVCLLQNNRIMLHWIGTSEALSVCPSLAHHSVRPDRLIGMYEPPARDDLS